MSYFTRYMDKCYRLHSFRSHGINAFNWDKVVPYPYVGVLTCALKLFVNVIPIIPL